MSNINTIKNSVQEVCEAVSAILSVDVTVTNTNLERIAATGKYKAEIGNKLPSGCYYSKLLSDKEFQNLDNSNDSNKCNNCETAETNGYKYFRNYRFCIKKRFNTK